MMYWESDCPTVTEAMMFNAFSTNEDEGDAWDSLFDLPTYVCTLTVRHYAPALFDQLSGKDPFGLDKPIQK